MDKLEAYIRNSQNPELCSSYHTHRPQRVNLQSMLNHRSIIKYCVAQGTILGYIIFLIYENIPTNLKAVVVQFFPTLTTVSLYIFNRILNLGTS